MPGQVNTLFCWFFLFQFLIQFYTPTNYFDDQLLLFCDRVQAPFHQFISGWNCLSGVSHRAPFQFVPFPSLALRSGFPPLQPLLLTQDAFVQHLPVAVLRTTIPVFSTLQSSLLMQDAFVQHLFSWLCVGHSRQTVSWFLSPISSR